MAERVSKIVKTVRRTLNVAPYENLDVSVTFEEDITWEDLKERQEKSRNMTKLLLRDYNKTLRDVCVDMGIAVKGTNADGVQSVDLGEEQEVSEKTFDGV